MHIIIQAWLFYAITSAYLFVSWSCAPEVPVWSDGSSLAGKAQVWEGEACCHTYLPVGSWPHTPEAFT